MGDRRFEREVLIKRVEGIRRLVQALSSLNDPHMEFTLLQSCFSLPEFFLHEILGSPNTTGDSHELQ